MNRKTQLFQPGDMIVLNSRMSMFGRVSLNDRSTRYEFIDGLGPYTVLASVNSPRYDNARPHCHCVVLISTARGLLWLDSWWATKVSAKTRRGSK